jgi:hypothetical protein
MHEIIWQQSWSCITAFNNTIIAADAVDALFPPVLM